MNGFFFRTRLVILGAVGAAILVYVVASYAKLSTAGTVPSTTATPSGMERGMIADRNGKPLAVQTFFYHLAITPSAVRNLEKTADALAPVTALSRDEIIRRISSAQTNFLYLKKKMTETEYEIVDEVIKRNELTGLHFDRIPGRIYPENALASQVIGFMGDEGQGLSGIEYSMQSLLAPQAATGNGTNMYGNNIFLTIDANLQHKLEEIARQKMRETQAESIMMIASDAKTGEILSYISLPSVTLNEYPSSSPEERVDRPAVLAYEPGSVFKIFSVSSFIDRGVVKATDTFFCDGVYEVRSTNGENIRINCLGQHGLLTPREALQYSCNDVLAQMSEKIDAASFISSLRTFGFGSRTGIELPGETRGSIKSPEDRLWSARSKPTISIGQEMSVSALQMVQAASALTNGGIPIKPSIIARVTDHYGNSSYEHKSEYKPRVVSAGTARYLLSCMETTTQSGTGRQAALRDISIGVKTGTAQMLDQARGGYSSTDFLSNCIAVFPIEDPKIILYIVITKAQGETYAGRIVAPVIAQAANEIIDHLGMSRAGAASLSHTGQISISELPRISIGTVLPDFTGIPKRMLLPLLSRDDLNILINGDGQVVGQTPRAGTPVTENMHIELHLE